MKAVVYHSPKHLTYEEVNEPTAEADELLLRVDTVGICGSEIEGYLGHSSVRIPPLIMGHEFSGSIVSIGDQVIGFNVGQKVVVNPTVNCGHCNRCMEGRSNICENRKIIGIHRPGAFAEYVAVPARHAVIIPDSMDTRLASLVEPTAVCLHSLMTVNNGICEPIVIIGAGAIGLLTLQVSKLLGFGPVLMIDTMEERLEHSLSLGADQTYKPQETDSIKKWLGKDGANVVLDCVGLEATRQMALSLVNTGGTVSLIGLSSNFSNLEINHTVRQEITIKGSYCYTHSEFLKVVKLLVDGKIKLGNWTTERKLEEAVQTLEDLCERRIVQSKVFLRP